MLVLSIFIQALELKWHKHFVSSVRKNPNIVPFTYLLRSQEIVGEHMHVSSQIYKQMDCKNISKGRCSWLNFKKICRNTLFQSLLCRITLSKAPLGWRWGSFVVGFLFWFFLTPFWRAEEKFGINSTELCSPNFRCCLETGKLFSEELYLQTSDRSAIKKTPNFLLLLCQLSGVFYFQVTHPALRGENKQLYQILSKFSFKLTCGKGKITAFSTSSLKSCYFAARLQTSCTSVSTLALTHFQNFLGFLRGLQHH